MAFKPQYRVTPVPTAEFRKLVAEGLSMTRIARRMHIAPVTLRNRFETDTDLQEAHRLGLIDRENNSASAAPQKRAVRHDDDDAEYGRDPEEKPIDGIIFGAIRRGLADRPALERFINLVLGRRVQVIPAIERLVQLGKILEAPKTPGSILTRYRPAPSALAFA